MGAWVTQRRLRLASEALLLRTAEAGNAPTGCSNKETPALPGGMNWLNLGRGAAQSPSSAPGLVALIDPGRSGPGPSGFKAGASHSEPPALDAGRHWPPFFLKASQVSPALPLGGPGLPAHHAPPLRAGKMGKPAARYTAPALGEG